MGVNPTQTMGEGGGDIFFIGASPKSWWTGEGGGGVRPFFFYLKIFGSIFQTYRVAVADPGFPKKGGGREISMRTSAPRAPAGGPGGPGGGAPGGYRVFSKYIRAFKMVVRSDRICNFSHWNFAYRALVGGEGCGVISFSVILRWPFWTLPTWKHNWLRTSEPIFSYFALKTCDSSQCFVGQ